MAEEAKRTITRDQHLQLLGLAVLSTRHNDALKQIVEAAAAIVEEKDPNSGHTGDAFWCGSDAERVETMLRRLKITVEPSPAPV